MTSGLSDPFKHGCGLIHKHSGSGFDTASECFSMLTTLPMSRTGRTRCAVGADFEGQRNGLSFPMPGKGGEQVRLLFRFARDSGLEAIYPSLEAFNCLGGADDADARSCRREYGCRGPWRSRPRRGSMWLPPSPNSSSGSSRSTCWIVITASLPWPVSSKALRSRSCARCRLVRRAAALMRLDSPQLQDVFALLAHDRTVTPSRCGAAQAGEQVTPHYKLS